MRNCGHKVEMKGRELKIGFTNCYQHPAAVDAAVHAAQACFFKGDAHVGKQWGDFAKKLYLVRNGALVGLRSDTELRMSERRIEASEQC